MNWRCDLYVYESCAGDWAIHVAGNRVVGDIPQEPSWKLLTEGGDEDAERFSREHKAVMDFLKGCQREPIDLPSAGESFYEPDAESAAKRLEALRDIGYVFPFEIIDEIRQESSEDNG